VCIAVPGRVLERYDAAGIPMAGVDVRGSRREACLEYLPEAQVGDWVLVHLGMALQRVDEQEALRHLALLAEFAEASGAGAAPAEGLVS
jgi:hydrogenase expression/formation protein HypC